MNIYEKAVQKFGVEHQKMMAIEEMAELMQAISKHNRSPNEKTRLNIVEEIADVTIMLEQLWYIYDLNRNDFNQMYDLKLHKLEKLLQD